MDWERAYRLVEFFKEKKLYVINTWIKKSQITRGERTRGQNQGIEDDTKQIAYLWKIDTRTLLRELQDYKGPNIEIGHVFLMIGMNMKKIIGRLNKIKI